MVVVFRNRTYNSLHSLGVCNTGTDLLAVYRGPDQIRVYPVPDC